MPVSIRTSQNVLLEYEPASLSDRMVATLLDYLISIKKLAMSTRVVKLDDSRRGLGDYLIRWLFRMVDTRVLNGVVAMVAVAANGQGQRLGDVAAGTTVAKVKAPITLDDVLHTMLPDDHEIQFLDAILLTDRDMNIVRDALRTRSKFVANRTAEQVKLVTEISSPMPAELFLQTTVADHQFMTTRGSA